MRYAMYAANIFMCQTLLCEVVQRNMRRPALVGKTQNAWVKYGLEVKRKRVCEYIPNPLAPPFCLKNLENAPLGVRRAG